MTQPDTSNDLVTLRTEAVELGSLVLKNVKRLQRAVAENRMKLAKKVAAADDEIDERYADLERRTFRLIALGQPNEEDLRFLVSLTRILYDIERSGDLAVNAAKGLRRQRKQRLPEGIEPAFEQLCEATAEVFNNGLLALASLDVERASRLDDEDDAVDDLTERFYELINAKSPTVELGVELSRAGRYMERIADHAVNIGDQIIYIVTGSFPGDGADPANPPDGA